MAREWYYTNNGTQKGPVSLEQLKQLAQTGVLLPTDLLWREGFAEWRPASNAKGLTFVPVALPLTPMPAANPAEPPRRRSIARKCGRLMMWFFCFVGGVWVLLFSVGFVLILAGNLANSGGIASAVARTTTTEGADEEFKVAASHVGPSSLVAAEMLIEHRNDDHLSWKRLEGMIDFQFGGIRKEFRQWKADRIAAGDRYE
jgi:hypothetical protein